MINDLMILKFSTCLVIFSSSGFALSNLSWYLIVVLLTGFALTSLTVVLLLLFLSSIYSFSWK